MKARKGFTLVEVMIVVSVIALLGALGSYGVLKAQRDARNKQAQAELEMIGASILQLAWDTGRWPNRAVRNKPGSAEIWNLAGARFGLMGNDGIFTGWKGPYYEGNLVDPWGNPYFFDPDYRVAGKMRIVVGSFGPNGKGRNLYDSDDLFVLLDD